MKTIIRDSAPRACSVYVRGSQYLHNLFRVENYQKRSENTKTVTVFIFFYRKRKSETVIPETETTSVFRNHRRRKFGTKNTSVSIGI
jgi:hypothetical protein